MNVRIKYDKGQSLFICECDYNSRSVPKNAGFSFNPLFRTWTTRDVRIAGRLRQFAEGSAKEEINRAFISVRPWTAPLSVPAGLELKDFQKTIGTPWILARNRSYLAAQAGMGKTVMAAVAVNTLRLPTVYVSPANLILNIEAEFKKWTQGLVIEVCDPKAVPHLNPDVLIVPDSILFRPEVLDEIESMATKAKLRGKQAWLFTDEAHRFKNEDSKRSRALLGSFDKLTGLPIEGLVHKFDKQTYLSGTPIPNRLIELYALFSKVAPETLTFMSKHEFGMHYCGGYAHFEECSKCSGEDPSCFKCSGKGEIMRGYRYDGEPKTERLEILESKIKDKFMLRLYKKDHLKELPAKTEEIVLIGDSSPKLIAMDRGILHKASPEDLMRAQFDTPHLATYRRMLGEYKVKAAVSFIREEMENSDEAFLVFAYHKKVIEQLTLHLKKFSPLVITGGQTTVKKNETVKTFQNGTTNRLMILNYIAGGLGYTLTKASRVISVEFSWVPEAENDQAFDRIYRIGQDKPVHHQYLVYKNSLDKTMMDMNFRKRRVTGYV